MRRRTRAAVAATTGLLLIGGAGTLSYWTDSDTIDGVELAAGAVKLENFTCDSADWVFDDGGVLQATDQIVPGDRLTKSCSFDVRMEGRNAAASLTLNNAPDFVGAGAFIAQLDAAASYSIAGNPVPPELTEANDENTVDVELSVLFEDLGDPAAAIDASDPEQNQNLTNGLGLLATLNDITVTLVQSTPLSAP